MTTTRALSAALLLGSFLAVTACSPDETGPDQTSAGTSSAPTSDTANPTSSGPDPVAFTPAPVTCEDLPREPTAQESAWLVEAGPLSGEAYDEAAAVSAARAQSPGTDEEWAAAVTAQVQNGYAETVCEMIRFSPDLGDSTGGPTAGSPDTESVGQNHFALVLDSSGSMAADAGGATRMNAAKEALTAFAETLPADATVSLRLYGHEGDNTEARKDESCQSSEVVYTGEPQGVAGALADVEPVGWTPLARAIEDSTEDIPEDATDAVIYVVTDGLESCGGDPVKAAKDVAGAGVEPIINVIGFQVGNSDQEALAAIAEAGGGEYTTANSADELRRYWREEQALLTEAWREWRRAEEARIQEVSRERYDKVWAESRTLGSAAQEDRRRARNVVAQLRREGDLDQARSDAVYALVSEHFDEVYAYAGDFRDNIGEIGDNVRSGMQELYKESNTTWQDYYDRKRASQD